DSEGIADTVLWGLLGCFIKGGMWGLVGGAILGVGLNRDRYNRKTIILALLVFVIAFFVGRVLINDPQKFMYFSNPDDRPRDESWAGFLFGALAFLAVLRFSGDREAFAIPFKFSLWGFIGGALGFSGGALWMVFGPEIPIEQKWIGWWKMMEFSFGFIFGAALGWCAYLNQDRLRIAGRDGEAPSAAWGPLIAVVLLVLVVFNRWIFFSGDPGERDEAGFDILRFSLMILFGYVVFGSVLLSLGLFSVHAAWQISITLTFFHTVLDYVRDLDTVDRFGYSASFATQSLVLYPLTLLLGLLVYWIQSGRNVVQRLFLLAVWACYLSSCARTFGYKETLFPPEGESALHFLIEKHPSMIFVHGTFTVSAIITTWFILSRTTESADLAVEKAPN
ncbi:MAG: hypothetical protein KC944_24800, partial [Candidatus Omnitrophica bacterium]|nr:hypothetical protein [Candidatus Omnitrophota bacterium]